METQKIEDLKTIGHFQIRFTTSFDSAITDFITLKLLITKDLQDFIKKNVIVKGIEKSQYENGLEVIEFDRYKVRQFWFSCLTRNKELIFNKELIDKGETLYKFNNKDILQEKISYIKENFNLLVQNVFQFKDIDVTITYN